MAELTTYSFYLSLFWRGYLACLEKEIYERLIGKECVAAVKIK